MYQFFAPLAEPVGATWLLMSAMLIWLLVRRQWKSAVWLGFPTLLLFLFGSTPIGEQLAAKEERLWCTQTIGTGHSAKGANETPADAVVALGGGDRVSGNDVLGFAMTDGASRMLTAIEMVRLGKAKTLVLGGSWPMPGNRDCPSLKVVQDWVVSWGLAKGGVTNLGICINTHDEALAFRKQAQAAGWSKVILVTSALHMRRSVALFEKQGFAVTPVAADFQVEGVSQDLPFSPFPRQHRLFIWALYLHEKVGWWVYRFRGWV